MPRHASPSIAPWAHFFVPVPRLVEARHKSCASPRLETRHALDNYDARTHIYV